MDFRKYLELEGNGNTVHWNLWDAAKAGDWSLLSKCHLTTKPDHGVHIQVLSMHAPSLSPVWASVPRPSLISSKAMTMSDNLCEL